MSNLPRNTILQGDAYEQLRGLPGATIDCVVTSPPFYLLRDYGHPRQLGLEPTVDGWVEAMRRVMGEVARVLKPTGSAWVDLGDSYSRRRTYGAPPKGLLLAPERLLLALAGDGWIVRNKVVWSKPNPMPTSVADRLNTAYDVVYFLVRSPRYHFDLDVIREPHTTRRGRKGGPALDRPPQWAGPLAGTQNGLRRQRPDGIPGHVLGKNPGDVWRIPTRGFRGAHFATFPEELVRRPILATCPEAVCTDCGLPWRRQIAVRRIGAVRPTEPSRPIRRYRGRWETIRRVGPLVGCSCGAPTTPGVVLDPFFGTGTVGAVARKLGRDFVGIELNPAYIDLARARLAEAETPAYERAAA